MARFAVLCVLAVGVAVLASAQDYNSMPSYPTTTPNNRFNFTAPMFHPDIGEPVKRQQDNYTGFVYSFNGAPAADNSAGNPNGMLQANQVAQNPFLSTLPGDGNGQTIVTMGPCSGNTPHSHPRGSEISFLLYGNIQFGMVEENAAGNNLILRNMTQNETIHVPTGIMHFSHNPYCQPAAFLASFANKDPGTQTTWHSIAAIPNNILHAGTGISEANWTSIKQNYPLVAAPGTGSTECLRRCGLDFAKANKLTPVRNPTY